ncbi:MAG: hypothetical protein K1X86_12110 [Ignavibacteria bacterium]|nr:hypothetical protein [Ignavibacteria bacterium]
MNKLKIFFKLLPVIAIASFIYFTTTGSFLNSIEKFPIDTKINGNKTSGTIDLWINLTSSSSGCLSGYYEVCRNGGPLAPETTEGFYVKVTCNEEFTICIKSGNCYGTYTGTVNCITDTFININLSGANPPCECF